MLKKEKLLPHASLFLSFISATMLKFAFRHALHDFFLVDSKLIKSLNCLPRIHKYFNNVIQLIYVLPVVTFFNVIIQNKGVRSLKNSINLLKFEISVLGNHIYHFLLKSNYFKSVLLDPPF